MDSRESGLPYGGRTAYVIMQCLYFLIVHVSLSIAFEEMPLQSRPERRNATTNAMQPGNGGMITPWGAQAMTTSIQ